MALEPQTGLAPSKPPFYNDPQVRAVVFQVLLLAAVVGAAAFLVRNTLLNLEQRNIATGFDFLSSAAGFGIIQTLVEYSEASSYGRAFYVALLNTLLAAGIGIVFATLLGFVIGVARLSPNWLISRLAGVYVEVFRNIPLLLQIFFWYFAVLRNLPGPRQALAIGEAAFLSNRGFYVPKPLYGEAFSLTLWAALAAIIGVMVMARWARRRFERTGQPFHTVWASVGLLIGLPLLTFLASGSPISFEYPAMAGFNYRGGMVMIPELVALVLALSIYTASFIAEIVRAGILAVSHGQTEAAYALGLRPGLTLRLVVIPQAMRVIIPPLTSQYLNLTKNSSLAAAIAYPDLVSVFAGTVLNQTGQAIEVIAITMSVYLTISLLISGLMNWYNRRMALVER